MINEREEGLLKAYGAHQERIEELEAERDTLAAQLEIARKALIKHTTFNCILRECHCLLCRTLKQLSDPAAALAEHDERVAERCIKIMGDESITLWKAGNPYTASEVLDAGEAAIRREFWLEERPRADSTGEEQQHGS